MEFSFYYYNLKQWRRQQEISATHQWHFCSKKNNLREESSWREIVGWQEKNPLPGRERVRVSGRPRIHVWESVTPSAFSFLVSIQF
jgi:hypothetical protein